jgi:hypothetical protein
MELCIYFLHMPLWHGRRNFTLPSTVEVLGWNSQSVGILLKVDESCNRPGVAQRVPGGLDSQISMTFGT